MFKTNSFLASIVTAILTLVMVAVGVFAQTPAKQIALSGEVVSVDNAKLVLKTAKGDVSASLSEKTVYKRIDPANPSLKTATASQHAEIAAGDKVVVTGVPGDDPSVIPALGVYLMTKASIAAKNTKESEEWRRRGISGKVTAVDKAAKTITLSVGGIMGATNVLLTPKSDAQFKRYSKDSINYSDAIASTFNDINIGDQVKALGDRDAGGAAFAADEVLSGEFQTVAGSVKSINAEANEIVITDIDGKTERTINLAKTSMMKKFPEEIAQRLAMAQAAGMTGGSQPAGRPQGGQSGQAGQQPNGRPEGAGRQGGGRPGSVDDMLERFETIKIADLKAGDVVAVLSTKTAENEKITAIKFLSGVEPFTKAAQASGGRTRMATASGGFTIPGLDGGGLDF